MNNILNMTIIVCILLSQVAHAQSHPEIKAMKLLPSGAPQIEIPLVAQDCVVSTSSEVNYGSQSFWQLQETGPGKNQLTPGRRMISLSIACPSKHEMNLIMRGIKSNDGELRYGDKGVVHILMSNVMVDGEPSMVATAFSDGTQHGPIAEALLLKPDQNVIAMKNGQRVSGNALTANLEIVPTLPKEAARVTAMTNYDAHFTIELKE